jgi:hypothetical protein
VSKKRQRWGSGLGVWWVRACGGIMDGIRVMWGKWLGSGYRVFFGGKNSSKKFEIKIVSKKRYR